MSCVKITESIEEYAAKIPGNNSPQIIANALGIWWEKNPLRSDEFPSVAEFTSFLQDLRKYSSQKRITSVQLPGQPRREYTIIGNKIYNNEGKEVFAQEGKNRNKILANLAVQEGRAITVKYQKKGETSPRTYVVYNKDNTIINDMGDQMKWGEENGDRKSILELAHEKRVNLRTVQEGGIQSKEAERTLDEALTTPPQTRTKARKEVDTTSFETPVVTSVEEQAAVDLEFDPQVRRSRVSLIARLFSNEITELLENKEAEINRSMMQDDLSEARKEALRGELYELDRMFIIKELTPAGIFKRVRKTFSDYVESSQEEKIQAEIDEINTQEQELLAEGEITEADLYSEEEKLEKATKKVAYKIQEYQKILRHFKALAEETSSILLQKERLKIDLNYVGVDEADLSEDTPEGENAKADREDDAEQEETFKDGWMTKFREVSNKESLALAVRAVIAEVPRLDYEGMYEEDDLGNPIYLDEDYVHATLIDKLRNMTSPDEMLPLLKELANTKPWVEQIIELLEDPENESLFSQFYQDFRRDYVEYWIQKTITNPDGSTHTQTICINKPEGIYYLIDGWRDNYEGGTLLDKDSVYTKTGEINRENAKLGLREVTSLINDFNKLDTKEGLDLLEQGETWNKLMKLFHMIGIDPNPAVLKAALSNIKSNEVITYTDPIKLLLPQLHIIFKGLSEGKVKSEITEEGNIKRGDLINTFGSAYNNIARMLAEVTEDAIESSVRENEKSYYSHIQPSYIGKVIKKLKNVVNDPKKFEEFMQKEYKDYDWFFKGDKWRSDWLQKLYTDPKMRQALQHKIILNADKKEYSDWDELDYTRVLLNEYLSEPKEKMAWYAVPNLSDAPSAEFIRFVRYTDGSELDPKTGRRMTYQESILNRLVDLVNQEYDRIQLVNARAAQFLAGENITPIGSFDITFKENGEVDNIGGAEFKFLPALNDYRYEDGKTFLQKIEELKEGDPVELEEAIKDALYDIMEEGFEEAYAQWKEIGLFEETEKGRMKYLAHEGLSSYNKRTAQALQEAARVLGSEFTTEMQTLLNRYMKGLTINDRAAEKIFTEINTLLMNNDEVSVDTYKSIMRNLTTENTAKTQLREYYWNSVLATSQIIQITTTDLAYYKNMEDFQKRYKEVYAPALRLNTGSKYGRQYEKTIYLKDSKMISSTLRDIEQVLDAKVKAGEISKIDKDHILSQFKDVNVADAQAYRSLSSYRAIMDMSGQWTPAMQAAYDRLIDGKWSMEDFNIIWQTKKPFVYTQISKDSGVEGYSAMKTPVQHKNSEFLLLALYHTIAGPLANSPKLRAINEFMEKHQIDVVQFESAVKVGNQGVIDLSDVETEEAVTQRLAEATGIAYNAENPNYVHTISYEDYGIQVATPEHIIDVEQLVGTQIRRLIAADIAPDEKITIGNRTMTKQEWLKHYNAIITENILQAFAEVEEIFKDPKEVEKVLLEQIRSSSRYGVEMLRACTLDEDGNFNLPLFDPVQSLRVQQLLNSIIKSRITKQKIKGGACIQVSCYGLTDDLKIVYEGEGKNKRIKYMEVYMPAYSKKFYKHLIDKDGKLDINKLPDSLRKAIGYRVPTEAKYSMVPMYIKGFLPVQNGSAIMLPAEITTLSGSDFDKYQC